MKENKKNHKTKENKNIHTETRRTTNKHFYFAQHPMTKQTGIERELKRFLNYKKNIFEVSERMEVNV